MPETSGSTDGGYESIRIVGAEDVRLSAGDHNNGIAAVRNIPGAFPEFRRSEKAIISEKPAVTEQPDAAHEIVRGGAPDFTNTIERHIGIAEQALYSYASI